MNVLDTVMSYSKIVFLAIKPQYFPIIVSKLCKETLGLHLDILISIMAGITLESLNDVRNLYYYPL